MDQSRTKLAQFPAGARRGLCIGTTAAPLRLVLALPSVPADAAPVRHDAGAQWLDQLVRSVPRCGLRPAPDLAVHLAHVTIAGRDLLLVRPDASTGNIANAMRNLALRDAIDAGTLLVVHEEPALLCGVVKMQRGGSGGRHGGVDDLTAALGTGDYWRLQIGVGATPRRNNDQAAPSEWLAQASIDERRLIDRAIARSLLILPLAVDGKFALAGMLLKSLA